MKNNILIILLTLTIFGGFIRFWHVNKLPVSPNWDEVSHGYNAYSILKTGKDEWGKSFPLIFRAYGDYKLPVYIYSTVIPVFIFGLNIFSVRFVSLLAGTLAIPGIYLLTTSLFKKNTQLGIIASFLISICPWHFFISRPALEANLSLTLTIYGLYFLLRFVEGLSSLIPASIFLGLSLHTYNSSRVFVPLAVLSLLVVFASSVKKSFLSKFGTNIIGVLLFGLSLLLVFFQISSGEGTARYDKVKILSPSLVYQIGENRRLSSYPPIVSKLIHNRPVYFTLKLTEKYLSYFSPNFLSQSKGSQYQFAIPGQNLFTWPVTILALLGIFISLRRIKEDRSNLYLITLLAISPLAASLTIDPPQAIRPTPMIPFVIIFSSLALYEIFLKKTNKINNFLFALSLSFCSIASLLFLNQYHQVYSLKYSQSWQYGYQEVIEYVKTNEANYDNVFITKKSGEPHMFYSFFTSLDPRIIQSPESTIRFGKSDWFWTDKIKNVYFLNDWQIPTDSQSYFILESGHKISNKNSLLITSPDHIPSNSIIKSVVRYLDGQPAFIIVSIQ